MHGRGAALNGNPMNDNRSQRWTGHYLDVAHRFVPVAVQQDAAPNARASNVVNAADAATQQSAMPPATLPA